MNLLPPLGPLSSTLPTGPLTDPPPIRPPKSSPLFSGGDTVTISNKRRSKKSPKADSSKPTEKPAASKPKPAKIELLFKDLYTDECNFSSDFQEDLSHIALPYMLHSTPTPASLNLKEDTKQHKLKIRQDTGIYKDSIESRLQLPSSLQKALSNPDRPTEQDQRPAND